MSVPGRTKRSERTPASKAAQYEKTLASEDGVEHYVLRLYISGATPKSSRAIENIKRVCETRLKDRYELEVIDVYQHPKMVVADQIIAAPTLIKKLPLPMRKLIGDLSSDEKVLLGLDLIKR